MSTADQARVPARAGRMPRVSLLEREAPLGVILLVPTVLVLGMFLAWPFIFGIWLSLTQSEIGEIGDFTGLGNYQFESKDGIFLKALTNTFIYTGVTTVFKLSLGLIMALLLNQVFPLQRFVRAALLLPWIIPSVLSTLSWRWMFDPTFSVVNWVAVHAHIGGTVNWLGTPVTAMTALIVVNVWNGMPFYGISFLAGLQVIPGDLYEAARVD